MKTLKELGLTDEEIKFVELVYENPGYKLYDCRTYVNEGKEYPTCINLYENPEKLGLIECVGSYKWKVTDKVKICLIVTE